MSELRAGVLVAVVIAVLGWFGFTKANPFSNPFELQAAFRTANGLKPNSPVRIAGVEVGKVARVEPVPGRGARHLPRGQLLRRRAAGVALRSGARGR